VESRRAAADDDQRQALKQRHVVVLLALKLRTASKHALAISTGYAMNELHEDDQDAEVCESFVTPVNARPSVRQFIAAREKKEFGREDDDDLEPGSLVCFEHPDNKVAVPCF
jgi:hypothetical protein